MNQPAHPPQGWNDRDPSDRRRIINTLHVERPVTNAVARTMEKMRRGRREGREATCMTFVGEAGVGKSAFLKHYAQSNGIVTTSDATGVRRHRPVLYVELPSACTVQAACEYALAVMMGPTAPTGTRTPVLFERQLGVQEVELIIFDEFQHVGEKGAEKTRAKTADFVKGLTKRTRIPVVMTGMKTIKTFVTDNDQLTSITPYEATLGPYDPERHLEHFRKHLAALDALLPFDLPSHLDEPDRAAALLTATQGYVRHLGRLLSAAGETAIAEGACSILDRHLLKACRSERTHPGCKLKPDDLFRPPA